MATETIKECMKGLVHFNISQAIHKIYIKVYQYFSNTLYKLSVEEAQFYSSEKLERFNCAGTVQDFMVAMLANLRKPVMSVQNAASWGYFNTEQSEWNSSILSDAGFPTQLLPDVIPSGDIAGTLADQWHGIPAGTPVGEFFLLHDYHNTLYTISELSYAFAVVLKIPDKIMPD